MGIEKNSIVKLTDDKAYFVLETAMIDQKKYVYLMAKEEPNHFQFYEESLDDEGLKLTPVDDPDEVARIGMQFLEIMKQNLQNRTS
ncbi:MAG: hypothetical protein HFG15_01285 [Bacilli bacterium]|nr:hypothetical protein [Bacilli bacterium]